MIVLALESSTASGEVAICKDGQVLAQHQSLKQKSHSEFMNSAVDICLETARLKLAQIDIFACGLGPGSFTGVRVAANIAKSFCYLLNRKLVAIDSLELLHLQTARQSLQVCLLNAHKNMVYCSFYQQQKKLIGPIAVTIPELENLIETHFPKSEAVEFVGEGFFAYEEQIISRLRSRSFTAAKESILPLATTLAIAAGPLAISAKTMDWNLYLPLYVRASEAEENLRLK